MWNSGTETAERRRRGVLAIIFGRLLLVIALLVVAAGVLFALLQMAQSTGPLQERKVIVIERGASSSRIAAQLENEGIIRSRHLMLGLLAWQRLLGEGRPLKAGEYAFQPGVSLVEVLEILRQGKGIVHRLTIPEGFSTAQVLKRVREHPALVGELTLEPEEGSLLPDTYLFTRGETRDGIVRRMQQAMQRLLEEEWPKRAKDLPLKSPREAVILASIVEKETAVPEERARVAAVYINRLKKGMPLQADPTVIYGMTKGLPLGRDLLRSDLRKDTPWNTYTRRGLPPTPIANPGRESILAVLHPMQTDELYFVADGTGRHLFARTLKEHNRNVAKLRRLRREQRRKAQEAQAGQEPQRTKAAATP